MGIIGCNCTGNRLRNCTLAAFLPATEEICAMRADELACVTVGARGPGVGVGKG